MHLSSMSKSLDPESKPLLEDSIYNIILYINLKRKLISFIQQLISMYMLDAQEDGKPELLKLWSTIKEDEQNHLKML